MSAVLIFVVISVHDFLAVNNPVGEGILVAEGWIPARTLAESASVFNSRHYSYLVVVGGPIQGMGSESNHPTTYDDLAGKRLEKLGFDTKKLVKIRVPTVSAGRTLAGATAVKRWLSSSGISVCCVDVFTVGVHARKSWILFRHALGDDYRVGIIAGAPASYNPRFWFFSARGIYIVVRNVAGYVYSKLWILFNGKHHRSYRQGFEVLDPTLEQKLPSVKPRPNFGEPKLRRIRDGSVAFVAPCQRLETYLLSATGPA